MKNVFIGLVFKFLSLSIVKAIYLESNSRFCTSGRVNNLPKNIADAYLILVKDFK